MTSSSFSLSEGEGAVLHHFNKHFFFLINIISFSASKNIFVFPHHALAFYSPSGRLGGASSPQRGSGASTLYQTFFFPHQHHFIFNFHKILSFLHRTLVLLLPTGEAGWGSFSSKRDRCFISLLNIFSSSSTSFHFQHPKIFSLNQFFSCLAPPHRGGRVGLLLFAEAVWGLIMSIPTTASY